MKQVEMTTFNLLERGTRREEENITIKLKLSTSASYNFKPKATEGLLPKPANELPSFLIKTDITDGLETQS